MKIIILSPVASSYFTKEQQRLLNKAGDVTYVDGIKPFSEIKKLFSKDKKIIAIDPDFCDWKISNSVLDTIPNLQAVCLQTTSFSWIDSNYAKKKGIVVTNLIGWSKQAVAEWALLMAINLARKIPVIIKDGWKGDFVKHEGLDLKGKTAGIIGLGRNGTAIADMCKGIGMNVVYWSRNSKNKQFKFVTLKELMATSDFIFPTFAQNKETEKLLTDTLLKSMKKTAIFVSTVHHYKHDLLLKMVKEGNLYGYGFELELSKFKEFDSYEGNVWAGPALGWATTDSIKKNQEQWTESIVNASKGKYPTKVN